ncbi:hypothetical protein DXG01_013069 [Tephrocybe rancida]|nr:hypothetical protein DXG01_013069 [Tephrocybe rancida]
MTSIKAVSELRACPDCQLEVDIILESSDGVRFAAHAQNLERFSEGFPPASFTSSSSSTSPVVQLEEKSQVVELLLQFMHLKPQPDIEAIPFPILEELANAVEKYLIFSAMAVCRMCMRDQASSHAMHVLGYAAKHGHKTLANQAAKYTMSMDFDVVKRFFGTDSRVTYLWVSSTKLHTYSAHTQTAGVQRALDSCIAIGLLGRPTERWTT